MKASRLPAAHLAAHLGHALAHAGCLQGLLHFGVQPVHDGLGRAGRRHQAIP